MLKNLVRKLIQPLGIDLVKFPPTDFDTEVIDIIKKVKPYTMTSPERIYALIQAVKYVVKNDIPGSIVECGVWRGGSMMAVAHTLNRLGKSDIDLFLFDTYAGMPKPTDIDVDYSNKPASIEFQNFKTSWDSSDWCHSSIEDVKKNLFSTRYDTNRFRFIKGKVEDTIPLSAPDQISILRLDTDWYESTRHELIHLFPRLSHGGVIIIDDYGHWKGSKKATDEYFEQNHIPILLNRIDDTGRIAVKL